MKKQVSKKAQAELITSVLLILIGIAAVTLVAGFIFNLVKGSLQGTDCFQTSGQLEVNKESGQTYFNSTSAILSISIKRGAKEFNLTGIKLVVGDGKTSKSFNIAPGTADKVTMASGTTFALPEQGGYNTYLVNTTMSSITTIEIYPVVYPKRTCEEGKITSTL